MLDLQKKITPKLQCGYAIQLIRDGQKFQRYTIKARFYFNDKILTTSMYQDFLNTYNYYFPNIRHKDMLLP